MEKRRKEKCWMSIRFASLVRIVGLISEFSCLYPFGIASQNQRKRRLLQLAIPFFPPRRVGPAKRLDR